MNASTRTGTATASSLSPQQLTELISLVKGADSVELKLSVPDANRQSAVAALGMDPLDAQIRQVVFFDTPDLLLDQHGVVVRARRVQAKPHDSVIKLRPVVPDQLPASVRKLPGFNVEVDAMPGGFVCSASMKGVIGGDRDVLDVLAGRRPVRKLFSKPQRALFSEYAPEGVGLDDLAVLGPINVLKLKFTPEGLARKLVAELWIYPDGTRILELSTKCPPADTFQVVAEMKAYLGERGIDLTGAQATKTRTALELYSRELSAIA